MYTWFGKNQGRLYLIGTKKFRLGGAAPAAPSKYAHAVSALLIFAITEASRFIVFSFYVILSKLLLELIFNKKVSKRSFQFSGFLTVSNSVKKHNR